MMSFSTRVLSDLRAQEQRLRGEFTAWRQRADPDGDLALHHTQVERTTHRLEGLLDGITEATPLAPGANPAIAALDRVTALRRDLGTVHLVWDFFRDKFAQRDTALFTDHLGAADDLAYGCYRPFQLVVDAARIAAASDPDGPKFPTSAIPGAENAPLGQEHFKAPPLIFYSSDRSPFAQARTSAFRPLGLSPKDIEMFRQVLLRLPVPVIGLPWAQARSIPSLVVVGHEAGHVVAEDLGLAQAFEGLIGGLGLDTDRTRLWQAWADECFADVFGVLATGGSYVERLSRQLADDLIAIRGERIDHSQPGAYPTAALRVALCQHIQEQLGLTVDPAWKQAYGRPTGDSFAFAGDVPAVAEALLHGPYPTLGGKGLTQVMTWDGEADKDIANLAKHLLRTGRPRKKTEVRRLVAAAVRAQANDPRGYVDRKLDTLLAQKIVATRAEGVRAGDEESPLRGPLGRPLGRPMGLESAGRESSSLRQSDWRMGNELASILSGAFGRAGEPEDGAPEDGRPEDVVSTSDPSPPQE